MKPEDIREIFEGGLGLVHRTSQPSSAVIGQESACDASPSQEQLEELADELECVPGASLAEADVLQRAEQIIRFFANEVIRKSKRIAGLEADLEECREFIESYSDVVDGSYGESAPNRAMQLCSMIDETLYGPGGTR